VFGGEFVVRAGGAAYDARASRGDGGGKRKLWFGERMVRFWCDGGGRRELWGADRFGAGRFFSWRSMCSWVTRQKTRSRPERAGKI